MSHFSTLISLDNAGDISNLEAWADSYISNEMEPFWEATEDPEYLEFQDRTDEVREGYNGTVDCIKLPDGRIVPHYYSTVCRFIIKDGKVYQKESGQLKHEKRTKKAKKLQALPDYPIRKLYPSIDAYAESYFGYHYDEELDAYGYTCNPNAFWDWYQIGGRWPFMFLVKEDCPNIIEGEYSWQIGDSKRSAPQGYQWVAGARKKDIDWGLMKSINLEAANKLFIEMEAWFNLGVVPENTYSCQITDEGIVSWGDFVYIKDETLEQYLERHELGKICKYPVSIFSYLENGEYFSEGDMGWFGMSSSNKPDDEWRQMTQDFIDRIPNEHFIITIDCHI